MIAGVVTSAVVAAIAFAASNGQGAQANAAGQVQLGNAAAFPMLAYSWGASNSGSAHSGGGAGAGKANVQDISFTKTTGSTTVGLLTSVTTGSHYPTAVVTAALGGSATMVYELENVIVTSVSLGGSGAERSPLENITLNFAKVDVDPTRTPLASSTLGRLQRRHEYAVTHRCRWRRGSPSSTRHEEEQVSRGARAMGPPGLEPGTHRL